VKKSIGISLNGIDEKDKGDRERFLVSNLF
jgi:hypothetical protein